MNIFQFIQIHYLRKERDSYFSIIINTKFNNEEQERNTIGFRQYAELGDREDYSEDKLCDSGQSVPLWKVYFSRYKKAVRGIYRRTKKY